MSHYSSQRILKNTAILYVRMAVLLLISLYTSRVIFNALGVEDYGLYNLVAGIVVFFSFLNNGLSAATKRYITTRVGKNRDSEKHIFNVCFQAHTIIAIIVFISSEIIGIWAIEDWLNIPDKSVYAAKWVYQISILITIIGIIKSPFDTTIIAYEKIGIYSYITIVDVVVKLLIVFLLQSISGDKLIIYALLLLGSCVITFVISYVYCRLNIPACRLQYVKDGKCLRDVFGFMGWSLLGQIAVVGTNQGVSVLINLFYSVVVNAALGISNTVTGIVSNFVSNFQVAFNPQIIKLYNNNENDTLNSLIFRASKVSSYLIIIFLIPICLEIKELLHLWLGEYPEYSPEFTILTLFAILIEAISAPLWMVVYSQTNIRNYQILISSVYSLNFFLGWLALYVGFLPYIVILVRVTVFLILLFIRLWYVHGLIHSFSIRGWVWEILVKSAIIILTSFIIVGYIDNNLNCNGLNRLFVVTLLSLSVTGLLIIFVGFNKTERISIINVVKRKINK